MKTAVIITPFDNYSYNVRIKYVEHYLKELGYQKNIVISSDWNHRTKQPYKSDRPNLELIHVKSYKRNLSLDRIISHFLFARRVYLRLKEIRPEFIYASVPPNFIIRYIAKYKLLFPKTQVICEVGDLWPETLPIDGWKKNLAFPILKIWSYLRDHYIHKVDGIIYECNLFRSIVEQKSKSEIPVSTIYLCKENAMSEDFKFLESLDLIQIAYIGSINNLIDIDLIVNILSAINRKKKVLFHVIGDGENADRLFAQCEKECIDFINHGKIYDDNLKSSILKTCALGMNIMKESVVVGATMKSLEYFHWGMAVINNIPADTHEIIERYDCGYNLSRNSIESIAKSIALLSIDDLNKMCNNSRKVYLELFDEKNISKQFKTFYKSLIK